MIGQKQRTAHYGTLENYVATFDETERHDLAIATLALMVAEALNRARFRRGSRAAMIIPVSAEEVDPQHLSAYLHELGHDVKITRVVTPEGDRMKAIPRKTRLPRYRRPSFRRSTPVTL